MTYMLQERNIYANGRPDVTASMDTATQNRVTNATVGTEFFSLDGAGVGAEKWLLTSEGWKIIAGDTGWIKLLDNPNPTLQVRRINDVVHISADNWSGYKIDLPVGFGFGTFDGTETDAVLQTQPYYIQQSVVSDHMNFYFNPNYNPTKPPQVAKHEFWDYAVNEKKDMARAVGVIEINPKNELFMQGVQGEQTLWDDSAEPAWKHKELWMNYKQTDKIMNTKKGGISTYWSFKTHSDYPLALPAGV